MSIHTLPLRDTRRYRRWSHRPAARVLAGAALCASLAPPLTAQAEIFTNHTPTAHQSTVILSDFHSEATPQTLISDPTAPEKTTQPTKTSLTWITTNKASPSSSVSTVSAVTAIDAKPIPDKLRPIIQRVAHEFALDMHLIAAVAATESGFNPSAISPRGAVGLMQLMPETAKRFGVRNIHASEENLRGGAAYLRWLLNRFSGDLSLALAAYNAGENRVIRAGKVPDIDETQRYVPHVLALRSVYSGPKHQPWRLSH
ncbi:MAG: lytic transglycosylase domain-containing protein [Leptothrix ochracea]|uniref:lytic transglycosylase domain-containing protein n=1 Tax=Leptothrix ochracea TaxID=735331 RepID=UPI0034E27A88